MNYTVMLVKRLALIALCFFFIFWKYGHFSFNDDVIIRMAVRSFRPINNSAGQSFCKGANSVVFLQHLFDCLHSSIGLQIPWTACDMHEYIRFGESMECFCVVLWPIIGDNLGMPCLANMDFMWLTIEGEVALLNLAISTNTDM